MSELRTRRIIPELTENEDSYSWKELNCFYRPWSIMYKAIDHSYFDLFLFYSMFYDTFMVDGWFSRDNYGILPNELFLRFSNEILDKKFGVRTTCFEYKSFKGFRQNIISKIDQDSFVLVPGDLINLTYYASYMEEAHSHFFIVKGYDLEKNIFYILDNMHVDGGASTVYKDFAIEIDKLYELNLVFFENVIKGVEPYFWILEKLETNGSKININEMLLEHCETLKKINSGEVGYETIELNVIKEIERYDLDSIQEPSAIWNGKAVYYDILFKFLQSNCRDIKALEELKEEYHQNVKVWDMIRLKIFYLIEKHSTDVSKLEVKIRQLLDKERIFREKVINIISEGGFEKRITNEGKQVDKCFDKCFILNNHNASIIAENDTVSIIHSDLKTYDTWIAQDNATQILFKPNLNNELRIESKVVVNSKIGESFHSGLIVKFKDNSKILFGIYKNHNITIFFPEHKDNHTVYEESFMGCSTYLKVQSNLKECIFYVRDDLNNDWREVWKINRNTEIKYIGLFSKTWEKCNHETRFTDVTIE